MCGLAGILSNTINNLELHKITKEMCKSIAHRGPDGQGFWIGNGICFGHQRLSINDLTKNGDQPLFNEDKTIIMICNGEIYNSNELRKDLIIRGHCFRGTSDNEVLIHLYEEYGNSFVEKLIGMFAFAIWNDKTGELILGRDRIGEKPLYYAKTQNSFSFSSEPKGLFPVPNINRDLEEAAISYLMLCPATPAPLTYFKGISALPPASIAIFKNGNLSIAKYWSLNFTKSIRFRKFEDELDEFECLWKRVVKDNSISDVPLAITLSGGVDSSSIAAVLDNNKDLKTFCLSNNSNGKYDPESNLARNVADILKINHTDISFNPDIIKQLPFLIAAHDQPIATYPILQTEIMSREISRYRKVALTGNGADEVFTGYPGYKRSQLIGHFLPYISKLPNGLMTKLPIESSELKDRIYKASKLPLTMQRGYMMKCAIESIAKKILTDKSFAKLKNDEPTRIIDEYANDCCPRDYLDTVTYSDLMVTHQHSTTVQSDIVGMRHGLEYRAPFLDSRILEFSAGLNRNYTMPLFSNRVSKKILKISLLKYIPKELVYAKKMGFGWNISYSHLMNNNWSRIVKKFVLNGRYLNLEIFKISGVEWAVRNSTSLTWTLLCFSVWHELNLERRTAQDLSIEFEKLYVDNNQ